MDTIPPLNNTQKCSNIFRFIYHFWDILKLKLKPFFALIEQVKQPSPSVNPASHASFKLGRIDLFLNTTGSNNILPLLTHLLNPSTKV